MSAPERIWAQRGTLIGDPAENGYWEARNLYSHTMAEYIRADLLAAAQAEIAQLRAERDAAMAGRAEPRPVPDRIDIALGALRDGWPDMVDLFTRGQCLTLAMMLRGFFPEAEIMYSRGEGHVYADIGGRLYDIRGRHSRAPDDLAPLDFAHGDRPHRWAKRDTRRLIETARIIEPEPQPAPAPQAREITVQEAARVLADLLAEADDMHPQLEEALMIANVLNDADQVEELTAALRAIAAMQKGG